MFQHLNPQEFKVWWQHWLLGASAIAAQLWLQLAAWAASAAALAGLRASAGLWALTAYEMQHCGSRSQSPSIIITTSVDAGDPRQYHVSLPFSGAMTAVGPQQLLWVIASCAPLSCRASNTFVIAFCQISLSWLDNDTNAFATESGKWYTLIKYFLRCKEQNVSFPSSYLHINFNICSVGIHMCNIDSPESDIISFFQIISHCKKIFVARRKNVRRRADCWLEFPKAVEDIWAQL